MEMTRDEVLAAKIARIRKYVNNECPHGVPASALRWLIKYEDELEFYMTEEIGEYKFYPGDHWTPPEEELLNEGEISNKCEEAINLAMQDELWEELNDKHKADLAEILDIEEVSDEELQERMERKEA